MPTTESSRPWTARLRGRTFAVALLAPVAAAAGWLGASGATAQQEGGRAPRHASAALERAAWYMMSLPRRPDSVALAAQGTQEGHWRFVNRAGEMFTVGTPNSTGRIVDLFFSRNVGLTSTGAPIPILGGARLTGKVGSNNIAVMDIQTDDALGQPGENFFVGRYSRDVGRSQIGALVINKQANIEAPGDAPASSPVRLQQEHVVAVDVRANAAAVAGPRDHQIVEPRVGHEPKAAEQGVRRRVM